MSLSGFSLRPACMGHLPPAWPFPHLRDASPRLRGASAALPGRLSAKPRTTRGGTPHGITGISSLTSPHTYCGIPERDRCPPAPCPGPVTNAALPARRIAPHPIRRSAFRPSTGPQEIWYPVRDRFRKTGRTPCPILPQSLSRPACPSIPRRSCSHVARDGLSGGGVPLSDG